MLFTNRQVHAEYLAALYTQRCIQITIIPSSIGIIGRENEWKFFQPYLQTCAVTISTTDYDKHGASPPFSKFLLIMPRLKYLNLEFRVYGGPNDSKNYKNDNILLELADLASNHASLQFVFYARSLGHDETAIPTLSRLAKLDQSRKSCQYAHLHDHIECNGRAWLKQVTYLRQPYDRVDAIRNYRSLKEVCNVRRSCWAKLPKRKVTFEMLTIGAHCGNEDFEDDEHGDCDTDDCDKHLGLD